jgi:hypothetical protein
MPADEGIGFDVYQGVTPRKHAAQDDPVIQHFVYRCLPGALPWQ